MRVPVSWLRDYVDVPPDATGAEIAASLVKVGLEEEALHGGDITGPLVVGRVLAMRPEPQKNGKTVNWCQVDVGNNGQMLTDGTPQGIVCGAHNFAAGDLVVVVLPGAVLPGGLAISARKTYGHVSAGMICSAQELGIGADHAGIVVLGELLGEEADGLEPGDDAVELLGLADEVVEVTVTPDRGYCFSLRGIAREYSHSTGAAFRDPAAVKTPEPNAHGYAVSIAQDGPRGGTPGCDRYVARVVRGVDAGAPSPRWMGKRLTEAGMRPISLAVDVTNYVMLALGQPLHAFDVSTLSGQIVVRHARSGERLTTLDDVERTLYPDDLLITDGSDRPLALAGVMGGQTSEITAATTDLLIEAAHFDATTAARSSRRHRLISEASKRFERGVDPAIADAAAQLAVDLLVELGGGRADDGVTDVDHRVPREPVELDPTLPARLVGISFGLDEVTHTLREIGCEVRSTPGGGDHLTVQPPSWRPDLANGPDFAEEVARLHGYDQIPSVLPHAPSGRGLTHGQRVRRVVAGALAAGGLVEALTYPFVGAGVQDDFGLDADDPRRTAARIANPLSEEAPLMRTSVLSTLVDALRRNVSRGHKDLGLYEIGLVTQPSAKASRAPVPGVEGRPDPDTLAAIQAAIPPQPRHLAILMAGEIEQPGPSRSGRAADWSDAIRAARSVGTALALGLTVTADEHAPWHPGRCARLSLPDGVLVGHAGELHPQSVQALGLPARTCAVELDLDVLTIASVAPVLARPLSSYPVAHSDVALLVAREIPAASVQAALRSGAGDLLESVRLFDVYQGDQIGAGLKSLAYHLVFRAPDRTLRTQEVNTLRDRAIGMAAAAHGAVQRG